MIYGTDETWKVMFMASGNRQDKIQNVSVGR